MTDCFDRNKFKEILVIIDSSKFNYSDKIGEFKYIDIRDSVNNIRNNTISKIDAKKNLSTLNKIKNAEIISYKNHTPKHKELLNLFNDLIDIILTDKTLESESQKDKNKNENEKIETRKVESRKAENEKIESRKEENKNEDDYENEDENENENEDGDETMDQNKKNKKIKDLNDILDEIFDKLKSFEEQIKSLKEKEDLKGFLPYNDFGDKKLKYKYFKTELADMSNEIDKKLSQQIFGHILINLADKLINTTNKEENQIIVKNIKKK